MKPDGVTMETTEPTEAATGAEPTSTQDNVTQLTQAQSQEVANNTEAAAGAAPEANGKSVAEVKPNVVGNKMHPTAKSAGASVSSPRPGTASHRSVNDNKSSNASAAKKTTTAAAGAVPKRPAAGAAASTVKTQTRVPDKKSAGPARTTSAAAATVANGTKSAAANGSLKRRPVPETVNGAKPKTTASASKTVASTAPKPNTATTFKAAAAPKTRPATVPSMTRPPSTTSRTTTAPTKPTTAPTKPTTATTKPATTTTKSSITTTATKAAASRATTAPSTGRTNTVQLKSAAPAVKKDVSRPSPMAAAKKPATGSAATKKPDPPKPTAAVKLNSASRLTTTKAADAKVSQLKTQQPAKLTPSKKTDARFHPSNRPLMAGTPPASPANRPAVGSASKTKGGAKPTQTVQPFSATRKMENMADSKAASARKNQAAGVAAVAGAVAGAAVASSQTEAESAAAIVQESSPVASAPEEINTAGSTRNEARATREIPQSCEVVSSPPQSPARTAMPQISPIDEHLGINASLATAQEQNPADPQLAPVVSRPCLSEQSISLSTEQTTNLATLPAATNVTPQGTPPTNLNDEEDEEEREGSQLVSVSEMSGTTQPTEESRPGSAGLVAGSAWRAGGALLSELDSEEVSGSQQGASELSAPGVLEGTESMDDLGDGSLKGAIDMEGASAGSPDFEKVPDIPVNDFDENEDEDDSDRVYDMDVGSERTDEPPRPRHDNDVDDDDDDDDVEMASEGVTESGLESYGNADEDDFAEDERLDNLNRVVQPPPPPPVLPSAPAAQWDQPNPFADPWAEPLEPVQVGGAAAASPLVDPWQLDSETPTQATAQAWLELGSDPPRDEQVYHQSAAKDETQGCIDQSSQAPAQTQAPTPLSAPGMSLSSTLSSESSTPEELGDPKRDEKLQPPTAQPQTNSPQPYLNHQDLSLQPDKGEKVEAEEVEPETLPADEVFGGPATAPTSNPSSSSVTEDEASDTEGEAQLDDSLEAPLVCNVTVDMQPPGRCCLSTVEEGEEAETEEVSGAAAEDATPPSATSMASYGFDTTTTASNSNAQSTGESCIKSPGIFSLEELPEEAKEPCLIPELRTQPCLAEQQYIECGKQEVDSAECVGEEASRSEEGSNLQSAQSTLQQTTENPEDMQHPYYSAICEKNEDSLAGFPALPLPHRRDHAAYPRTYYDIVKQQAAAAAPPKLTCADLPPRNLGQQALSPQLRRLEQHQRQLQEMQQRRAQQSRPLEEAEQERKRREEEELRRKKEEAEEEIKRNKLEEERKVKEQEELKQRKDLELQLQQQQEELMQRQQIMQWQQELQQSNKVQTVLLSPSSGLCTIYETLENSDEEEAEDEVEGINELKPTKKKSEQKHKTHHLEMSNSCEAVMSDEDKCGTSSASDSPPPTDSLQSSSNPSQDGDDSSPHPLGSPERPPPLDLDWGKKVDIVQQLINQTLLLNGDGCSSLLLLPGGAGGTLSPLESSLWPSLLPPLTPPSATVTSVSSFSPEATGSSPQGEWTVVELETHH